MPDKDKEAMKLRVAAWVEFLHLLGIHNWSNWKTYTGEFLSYPSIAQREAGQTEAVKTTETRQARRCEICHKEQHRNVRYASGKTYDDTCTLAKESTNDPR